MKKGASIARAIMQVVLSRDGVIWDNRRCTEGLFGEQYDGVAVAKAIHEETKILFVE